MRIAGAPECALTPIVSCTPPERPRTSGLPVESSPRHPNRHPCIDAFRQPPARTPARALLKGDGALHGGLQAAVFVEDTDIALKDGLLDPGEFAPGLPRRSPMAGRGIPEGCVACTCADGRRSENGSWFTPPDAQLTRDHAALTISTVGSPAGHFFHGLPGPGHTTAGAVLLRGLRRR